jgi:hypothetical protein
MRNKIVAVAVAGGLVLGTGIFAVLVVDSGVAFASDETDFASGGDSDRPHHRHRAILEEVLEDLVASGTIDQDQVDAITEALVAKAESLRAERDEVRDLIEGFLDDDVITEDELAQLPDDHPFNNPDGRPAGALEDGQLTRAEIEQARPHPRGEWFKRGIRWGALLDDGGIDQSEYDGLPDGHPLKDIDVSEYLDDGVITIAELREIRKSQSTSGDDA